MAITYLLAPNPKWYIADLTGLPLGGGYMATQSQLVKPVIKPVFMDAQGNNAWPYIDIPNTDRQGILFDENGSQGPFYWEIDSTNLNDTYYIEVFDSDGVLQWTIENFAPPGSGGGGGGTVALELDNLVSNNVMYRNVGASANPIAATELMISPGAHQGFAKTVTAGSRGYPDVWFFKSNTNATDSLSFVTFASTGETLTGDVTPVEFLRYSCTHAGAGGEAYKYVQFPITQNVFNLNNQSATLSIWARVNSGVSTLALSWYQFTGDGGAPTVIAPSSIQNLALTNGWQQFVVSANIPALPSPLTLGTCGNHGLFLQVGYPLSAVTSIDFTKPAVYLGSVAPSLEYQTYDMISTILDSPRTGDIKTTLDHSWLSSGHVCPYGWVEMNDGTIGSASSAATARANIDTFPLYNLIWNNVSRTWAPIVGATTGTAVGDFAANLPLRLTRALGRVFAGTINSNVASTFTFAAANPTSTLTIASTTFYPTGAPVVLTTTGALPTGLSLSTTYYVINLTPTTMNLATTFENAIAGTALTFNGTTGSGVQTVTVTPYVLGQASGEETHALITAELPAHQHNTWSSGAGVFQENAGTGGKASPNDGGTSGATGGNQPHNNMQPTTYMNVYIKL